MTGQTLLKDKAIYQAEKTNNEDSISPQGYTKAPCEAQGQDVSSETSYNTHAQEAPAGTSHSAQVQDAPAGTSYSAQVQDASAGTSYSAQVQDASAGTSYSARVQDASAGTSYNAQDDAGTSKFSKKALDKVFEAADKASNLGERAAEFAGSAFSKAAGAIDSESGDIPSDSKAKTKQHLFSRREDKEQSRDSWILSRIDDAHLMEYLRLEQKRSEMQQEAKSAKEKRIFRGFELTVCLAAVVAVIYLLKDNPTILVNILYIAGITAAFWIWKKPHEK